MQRTLEEAWSLFRFGAAEDFAARRAFAGQRFPVSGLEAFARGFVPRWTSTGNAAVAAFTDLLRRFERAVVIRHSQGGQVAFEAAARLPDRIAALVAVEPSGFSDNVAALRQKKVLMVYGDYQVVGNGVPDLLGKGRDWAAGMQQAGGNIDIIALPERGIRGNSHMLMMDDNNEAVLGLVMAWLKMAWLEESASKI